MSIRCRGNMASSRGPGQAHRTRFRVVHVFTCELGWETLCWGKAWGKGAGGGELGGWKGRELIASTASGF